MEMNYVGVGVREEQRLSWAWSANPEFNVHASRFANFSVATSLSLFFLFHFLSLSPVSFTSYASLDRIRSVDL